MEQVLESIKRTLRLLVVATVVLYLMVAGGIIYTYVTVATNKEALCSVRQDFERRVETSQQFLIDHPKGTPGIPTSILRRSIDDQKRTIEALQIISCKYPPVEQAK